METTPLAATFGATAAPPLPGAYPGAPLPGGPLPGASPPQAVPDARPAHIVGRLSTRVLAWVSTTDHKRVGILYGVTALSFFVLGGIYALIIRLQLARPEARVVSPEGFSQLFTMHGTSMVFLAMMPLAQAFFNYLTPLMIGARDVASPRLNALSYWIYLAGGLLITSSWLVGQAPDAGWFGYANLTERAFSPGLNQDFWALGLLLTSTSSIVAALNLVVTIVKLRAPGMTLLAMPVFTWMTFITAILLLLALPVLTAAVVILFSDRTFGTHFFQPSGGGDAQLWVNFFWFFGHPEVYILILPAMGIVSEVIPVFAGRPLFGRTVVIFSGIAIGTLAWSVWGHHMFTQGLGPAADSAFGITTMLISIPTGIKVFNWITTMWGGRVRFTSAMLFAVGFVALFVVGGLTGVMMASPPVDTQVNGTYFVVGHFHYVLVGGTLMGLTAGVYYWLPKVTGRLLGETLGRWHFWLIFAGINLTFMPMHVLGVLGMPRRVYTYAPGLGWDVWNLVASLGAFCIALSVAVFVVNVVRSVARGAAAGSDPWNGRTLEWSTTSPPPADDFAVTPTVDGVDAWWLTKQRRAAAAPSGAAIADPVPADAVPANGAAPAPPKRPENGPSYYPVTLAAGLLLLAAGVLTSGVVSVIGLVVFFGALYGWALDMPATSRDASRGDGAPA